MLMTFYDLPCWSSSLMRLVTWNSNILQNISDNDEPVQFRNREVRNARHIEKTSWLQIIVHLWF